MAENAGKRPYIIRTVAEWREIYLRVRDWDGGDGNAVHRQCPVCLGRFTPKQKNARFCSQSCRNLWNRARAIAGEADKPSNRQTVKPSNRYVELAVCESCRRVFHPASMRGDLCMSCAARQAAKACPNPAEPPRGFVKAICPDCGNAFVRPATVRPGTRCWKCSDKRKKAAERRRRRRVKTPAGFEAAVCPDCGGTFQRPLFAGGGGRKIYCPECADKRRLASCRAAWRMYAKRKASSEANRQTVQPSNRPTVKQGTRNHENRP